ncbi:MAG: hypothetical protein GF390_00255 [Candidatus Pacebacteria bacterium]|nr:hypothetical protein [Candidatus Paceibacterota bacterium]
MSKKNSKKASLPAADTKGLDQGQEKPKLPTSDDLALAALNQANKQATDDQSSDDEVAKSDQLAETLISLQGLIERHADRLQDIKAQLKDKRQSLRNVFTNDTQLSTAKDKASEYSQEVRQRKSQLQSDPQVTSLQVGIKELKEQQKELEQTLSNHLLRYYGITKSTSFDTSDGDQWEFKIKAKVKPRRRKK